VNIAPLQTPKELKNNDDLSLKEMLAITTTDEETVKKAVKELLDTRQEMQMKIDYLERDIDRIARYIDQLQHDVTSIEYSRAWQIGFKIVSLVKRATGRNVSDPIFEDIKRMFNTYHHWKKSRG